MDLNNMGSECFIYCDRTETQNPLVSRRHKLKVYINHSQLYALGGNLLSFHQKQFPELVKNSRTTNTQRTDIDYTHCNKQQGSINNGHKQ